MPFPHLNKKPVVPASVFVAPGAQVIGDVTLGENASIWFNVVIRADIASISIGHHTNVQDGTIIHIDKDVPTVIGNHVSIGHNAIVHSAIVEDHVLIGMGAIILSGAKIGKGAMVAAGALVKEGFEVPPNTLVVGIPARIARPLRPEELADNERNADDYNQLREQYLSRYN